MAAHKRTLAQRISTYVEPSESGCWEWTGAHDRNGYGHMGITTDGKMSMQAAHRLSYSAFVGPIPDGMFVCHRCDNRKCVNPNT